MILAAGLTPAWQQIMRFPKFARGEVNRAAEVHWCASGKVLNVGMALAALGAETHTLAPLGGWSGDAIAEEFLDRQLRATWIGTQKATRICTTLLEADGATTELVENAQPISRAELDLFVAEFRRLAGSAEMVVLTGSLPKDAPPTLYRDLLHGTTCPVVLDARGPELLAALELKPRVVKPNRDELALTVGHPLPERASIVSAMRELCERGAESVVVTAGKSAVLVVQAGQVLEVTPPVVTPIVNPIGCGDCLAAGVALGLVRGESLESAVRYGMAAAADNISQLLPARLSLERVAEIRARLV